MPTGGDRAGVTSESLAEQLRDVLERALAAGEAEGLAPHRLRELTAALTVLEEYAERLSRSRLEAVGELRRQGWSYQRIALRSGLSKSRIAQLARAVGLPGPVS